MGGPTLFGDAAEVARPEEPPAPKPSPARARPAPAPGFTPALVDGATYPERAAAAADLQRMVDEWELIPFEVLCRMLVATYYTLRRQELRRVILATIEEVKRP